MSLPSRTTTAKAEPETSSVRSIIDDALRSKPTAAAGDRVAIRALAAGLETINATASAKFRELRVELDALKRQVADLAEQKAKVDYKGVWRGGESYPAGCFCTDRGGMWFAQRQTDRRPGDGDSGWVLAIKAGRDRR